MSYSDVMSTISAIAAFIAIPASYFCGVRVGRVNDKRKEFNAVAEPILKDLEEHLELLESECIPPLYATSDKTRLNSDKVKSLKRRLNKKELLAFNDISNRYADLLEHLINYPAPFIGSDEEWVDKWPDAIKTAKQMIELIKLK
ncbi:hypothetical protein [Proteus terrae]|uniref:hypothetical protein n=1 Tax=Proteus terrae TaxID=1574161 RepID=UPI001F4784B8|nr:hypothetical protein [Proteus terrae]